MKTLLTAWLFCLCLAAPAAAQGQPDIPPGLASQCNQILSDLQTELATDQPAYAAAHGGRFFQGLKTPATTPADGASGAPDKTRRPSDQAENWNDANVTLPAQMQCSVEVHVYQGPQGWGYVIIGEVGAGGKKYHKAINVGPESHRSHDWREIPASVN